MVVTGTLVVVAAPHIGVAGIGGIVETDLHQQVASIPNKWCLKCVDLPTGSGNRIGSIVNGGHVVIP